eukprot:TRINITY_DN71978_c0_g1_i1.p1 TRINITY_DN71978_c0_g1~~TRINITY_DN71978_c0_g1_i1.p1  ORF type:complete len:262 (-),score=21.08 TRINITY_DN71978_c0_g1_i1:980-1765(-)
MRVLGIHSQIIAMLYIKENEEFLESAFMVLGNICASSIHARDELLATPLTEYLVKVWERKAIMKSLLRTTCWVASNLCRGQPHPVFEKIQGFIHGFSKLLLIEDEDVLTSILLALNDLCEKCTEGVDFVIKNIEPEHILMLANDLNKVIRQNAVLLIGNICAADSLSVERILNHNCLKSLHSVMKSETTGGQIVKDACWAVSNIALGPSSHVKQLVESGIPKTLCSIIRSYVSISVTSYSLYLKIDQGRSCMGNSKYMQKM